MFCFFPKGWKKEESQPAKWVELHFMALKYSFLLIKNKIGKQVGKIAFPHHWKKGWVFLILLLDFQAVVDGQGYAYICLSTIFQFPCSSIVIKTWWGYVKKKLCYCLCPIEDTGVLGICLRYFLMFLSCFCDFFWVLNVLNNFYFYIKPQ